MLIPARRVLSENYPLYYPFGNTRVRNVLKDYRFVGDNVKILFLGSGDLRNALVAAGNRKNLNSIHLHLNDLNPSIVARNILILKIISAPDFDTNNKEDIAFLWDLWYNAEWPISTHERFKSVLKKLLDSELPDNVVIPKSNYLITLKTIWATWSSTSSKTKSESDLFMKKIQRERKNFLVHGWYKMHLTDAGLDENSLVSSFPEEVDGYAFYLGTKFEDFDESVKKKCREEARQYFSTGTCRLEIGIENAIVNPTMLDPTTNRWQVHYQLCPFDGYLPLTREELDTPNNKGTLIRTCQKILQNLVSDYKKRIDGIKFFFHLEDALEFCLSQSTLSFDVIDCSNLVDHIGLVHLINACERILSDTPGGMLFTESMTWISLAYSELEYVEKALCCPLSMIPTVYGLKLTNHVELGASTPTNNLIRNTMRPILLCWKKALTFQNVRLSSSPELSRCLNQIAQKCFLSQSLTKNSTSKSTKESKSFLQIEISFTPLTFSYVVNSMISRVGGDPLNFRADAVKIPSVYNLYRRTLEAWKNKEIVVKLSSNLKTNLLNQSESNSVRTPSMRIVLAPLDKFKSNYMHHTFRQQLTVFDYELSDPEIHVIDNFELHVKQNANGQIQTATISFLLMPDHGLEETHCAYVFDVVNSLFPIFILEPISSMRVEKYCQPYPFSLQGSQLPLVAKELSMRVDSCIESLDKYTLQIGIESSKNISGLIVSPIPKQCLPCESVHGLSLSLSQPNNIKPLKLSFPFPILVKDVRATLHRKNRLIDLVLKKALYEPWPYEFQTKQSRWIVDNLKPWEDGISKEDSVLTHLAIQFQTNVLRQAAEKTDAVVKLSALNQIRLIIKSLFCEATTNNQEFVNIRRKDSTQSPDWCIRVHLPVRISPLGSPVLLLSAIDHRFAENLVSQGKLDMQESGDDFTRIFETPKFKKHPAGRSLTIWTFTSEEELLLRYVLRLNSTKIVPSTWQKNNLPQGENSPWIATFVSPLYDDCPSLNQESLDIVQLQKEIKNTNESTSCVACKKIPQNLKRCSRCRTVFYCSVECQRGHWAQHKNVCNNSRK